VVVSPVTSSISFTWYSSRTYRPLTPSLIFSASVTRLALSPPSALIEFC